MIYEPEAHEQVTAYLLERCSLRRAACRAAFRALGVEIATPAGPVETILAGIAKRKQGGIPEAAHWLPALCAEAEDVPHLIALLEHDNGWVRINAAKALAFLNEQRAVEPLSRLLAASKPEAQFGYNGRFFFTQNKHQGNGRFFFTQNKHQGQSEYNDQPPRWRQAFVRALGLLSAREHTSLLVGILWDRGNVLEVQMAAAQSLHELDTPQAVAALKQTESRHPFYSIRLFAREALWRRGLLGSETAQAVPAFETSLAHPVHRTQPQEQYSKPRGIVFIQGDNNMPNDFQIDHWRQTYSTTDSGPTYRMGRNIMRRRIRGRRIAWDAISCCSSLRSRAGGFVR